MALLEVDDVSVRFGGIVALDGLSFSVAEGQICGLIGPNGAGKTTLFNCVSGIYRATHGRIVYAGRDLLKLPAHRMAAAGIARTFQNLALFPSMTLLENTMTGAYARGHTGFGRALTRLGVRREDRALEVESYRILTSLDLADLAYRPAAGLPFGTLKRLELARALAARPSLLLLDEPASGLTHGEVGELAAVIRRIRDEYALTVLLVEHHMAMVMGISDKVVAMDFGRRIAEGTPDEVRRDPLVIAAYLGTEVET